MAIIVKRNKETNEYQPVIICDWCGEPLSQHDGFIFYEPNGRPSEFNISFVHKNKMGIKRCDGNKQKSYRHGGKSMIALFDGILENLYMEQNAPDRF